MIHTREHLIHVLTEAAEIEHNLLCSYLYAVFSIKRSGEPGLTGVQAAAVERWRKTILGVALEEMGHLATVNNLILAVGGSAHFDRPNLPLAPGYHPAGIVVRLTPFDVETLEHFIFLERAADQSLQDADGFSVTEGERDVGSSRFTPSAFDYATIGELYDAMAEGFISLTAALGEGGLIDPTGGGQLDSDVVQLPNVPRITSLPNALAAIDRIKEEGEGSSGAHEESHFDRFCAIRDEWRSIAAADPQFRPAWPAAHDPVMRKPAQDIERLWICEEPAVGRLDLGNALYGTMLQLLSHAFSCPDRQAQARHMNASVQVMEACAAVAACLARTPVGATAPGVNAGITFATPRNLGLRSASLSTAHFTERLRDLRAGAGLRLDGEPLEKVHRRLDAAIERLAGAD